MFPTIRLSKFLLNKPPCNKELCFSFDLPILTIRNAVFEKFFLFVKQGNVINAELSIPQNKVWTMGFKITLKAVRRKGIVVETKK